MPVYINHMKYQSETSRKSFLKKVNANSAPAVILQMAKDLGIAENYPIKVDTDTKEAKFIIKP